jgi:hypothetical protein
MTQSAPPPPAPPAPPVRQQIAPTTASVSASAPVVPTRASSNTYAPTATATTAAAVAAAAAAAARQHQSNAVVEPSQKSGTVPQVTPSMAQQAAQIAAEFDYKRPTAPAAKPTVTLPPRPSQRALQTSSNQHAAVSQTAAHLGTIGLEQQQQQAGGHSVATSSMPAASSYRPAPTAPVAPAASAVPLGQYTYEDVSSRQVYGMDTRRLEEYLKDADFERALGMGRDAFNALPQWRKDKLKKDAGLW